MEGKAAILIGNLASKIGESLDEPVLEYLAGLLTAAASDPSEIDGLAETLTEFLPGVLHQNPTAAIRSMVLTMNSTSDEADATASPSPAIDPMDPDPAQSENQAGDSEDWVEALSTTVASVKLNVKAKEFVPAFLEVENNNNEPISNSLHESNTEDAELVLDEGLDENGIWPGVSSVDTLGILSCLFPAISCGALQALLQANNGDLRDTVKVLSQMNSQYNPNPVNSVEAHPTPVVDMSEESFPLLSTSGRELPVPNPTARVKNFAEAARKGAACKEQPVSDGGRASKGGGGWTRRGKIIPWVSTGDEVSEQYAKAREEAREFAIMRNSCFERATKAYLAGKKALAKELGAEGRLYCAKMKECHSIAAEGIFMERNERFRSGRPGGAAVIDLHGLHVSEARYILKRELGQLYQEGKPQIISLLVGTGHHTKGSRTPSRLPGAVQQFLEEEGYPHQTKDAGVIDVKL